MRILFFLLFPIFLSAQINRAYGVIEIGATFPTSSTTGPKFAYRTVDSSFYRWASGNTWVKIIEPSIIPDTLYLTEEIGTSYKVSGDTINLTPYLLKSDTTAMLVKYIERGDTAAMLAPYVTFGNLAGYPTGSGTADRSARWSATNTLAAGNLTDNGTKVQALLPFQFQTYTTAGLPTGVTGYHVYNTTTNGPAWYQGSRWAYGLESTFNRGTATRVPFFDENGQITDAAGVTWNNTVGSQVLTITGSNTGGNGLFKVSTTTNQVFTNAFNVEAPNLTAGNRIQFLIGRDASNYNRASIAFNLVGLGSLSNNINFSFFNAANIFILQADGKVGFGATPSYSLDVNYTDAIRIARGTTAQTPTEQAGIFRYNSDSTAYQGYNGTRVYFATRAYARSLVNAITFQNIGNTNLTLSGNRVLTGASYNLDFLGMNRFKVDSMQYASFTLGIRNNTTSSSMLVGGSGNFPGNFTIQDRNSGGTQILKTYMELDKRRSTWNYQWNLNETWQLPDGSFKWTRHVQYDTVGVDRFNINYGSLVGDIPITHRIAGNAVDGSSTLISFFAHSTTGSVLTNWNVNGLGVIGRMYMNGTFELSRYGVGNKEAADLSKTESAYAAIYATDGTLLEKPLSSLADGNGIYTGSGTLASHTTRAAIPETGNLLFTQKYNSNADSAFIQVVNNLDGNREVRLGLTDTASTGRATLVLKQDADNEVMAWELQSSDGSGATRLTGDGGNIAVTVDEGFEFQISGMVRAKREAYHEVTSTTSPDTLSSVYSDNLINQGGTQATFTLVMPPSPDDGQICAITYNNAITTLTIDGNGETIVGSAVTTGVPGSQRKFKYYSGIGWIKLY